MTRQKMTKKLLLSILRKKYKLHNYHLMYKIMRPAMSEQFQFRRKILAPVQPYFTPEVRKFTIFLILKLIFNILLAILAAEIGKRSFFHLKDVLL
ncbi:unnamed protein product [Caenorhabditis angaria]|uniref:Uncharacterized protein n=1 Tax=Caenorhabditis angaria TaxID=860376 RepID=A0A9P1N549_9PELO|nr:unnamed protein product [Caenorhabditis angaria]